MKKLIFALIAGVTAVGAAQAQAISRPYVGLGVASSDHDLRIGGLGNTGSEGYKANAKIFGGVELTPMFGIEAGYTDIRSSDHTFTIGGVPGRASTDGSRSYLAAKATMPVNEMFSVYGKLGAGYSKTNLSSSTPLISRSDSKTELYGAVGGQYNLNEKVALTLEYERYGKTKEYGVKADAITAGAKFSF
ncbi:MAG: porin family protein [Bdellovibrionales bacterium]|nr:porin family protein [Massilia sp.]